MAALSQRCLGLKTFFPRPNSPGDDGRPLNARIESRFHRLRIISREHPNLCQYLDLLSGHRNRLLVVSEHYSSSLQQHREEIVKSDDLLRPFLFQVLQGLSHLHSHGIAHRNLEISNILFDDQGQVKLADFGLFEITNHGKEVNFIIGHPLFLPPEIIFAPPLDTQSLTANIKVDVWSLGILLLLLLRNESPFTDNDPTFTIDQYALLFQRHARTVVNLHLQQRSSSSTSSSSTAWKGVLAWPNDLLTHPTKYRPPPEAAPAPTAPLASFRNPAFWDEDVDVVSKIGPASNSKSALMPSAQHSRTLSNVQQQTEAPKCKYCQRSIDVPEGYSPSSSENKANGGKRSFVMCLECWLDVENLNQPAPGQIFGRQRVRVTVELQQFLASCLSLHVENRPTAAQLLSHPYLVPLYQQQHQQQQLAMQARLPALGLVLSASATAAQLGVSQTGGFALGVSNPSQSSSSSSALSSSSTTPLAFGGLPPASMQWVRTSRLRAYQLSLTGTGSGLAPVTPLLPPPPTPSSTATSSPSSETENSEATSPSAGSLSESALNLLSASAASSSSASPQQQSSSQQQQHQNRTGGGSASAEDEKSAVANQADADDGSASSAVQPSPMMQRALVNGGSGGSDGVLSATDGSSSSSSPHALNDPLSDLKGWSWDELYYLWTKAGGDIQGELVRLGAFEMVPSIESLPVLVRSLDLIDDIAARASSSSTSSAGNPSFSFSSSSGINSSSAVSPSTSSALSPTSTQPSSSSSTASASASGTPSPSTAQPNSSTSPQSAPESAPMSANTAAVLAAARRSKPVHAATGAAVHVLAPTVTIDSLLQETSSSSSSSSLSAPSSQSGKGQRGTALYSNRGMLPSPASNSSSSLVAVAVSDSYWQQISNVHRYDPTISSLSLNWLKPYLPLDPALLSIAAANSTSSQEQSSSPSSSSSATGSDGVDDGFLSAHDCALATADTQQMSNEELFRHTLARLRRIRALLRVYPASRRDLIRLTMPLAAALLQSYPSDSGALSASATPAALSARFGITSASVPPASPQSLSQSSGMLLYGSVSSRYSAQHGHDMPCFLRRLLWPVALDISPEYRVIYDSLETAREQVHEIDHQLDIDLPRCHQYHSLLALPDVQITFRRILKSWVAAFPNLRYWQGLDSLCAPLLALLWPDEALTFAVLSAITRRYLSGFLAPDNSACLNVYLATFCQLLSYHDPELAAHLDMIGFTPENYIVPWFMTLFAHVLPMEQLYPCLDLLLQGPAAFPVFLAVAILISLRDILLARDCTGCMVYFANVLAIECDEVLRLSLITLECTPPSFFAPIMLINDPTAAPPLLAPGASNLLHTLAVQANPSFFRFAGGPSLSSGKINTLVPPRLSVADLLLRKQYITVVDTRSPAEFMSSQWPRSLNVPYLVDGATAANGSSSGPIGVGAAPGDLQQLVRLANKNYADANFNAFMLVVGNSTADESKFCGELVRQGISHVCILDVSSLTTSSSLSPSSRQLYTQCRGGWSVLQVVAHDQQIALEPERLPLQPNIQR